MRKVEACLQGQTEETRPKVTMHVLFFFGFTKCEASETLVPRPGIEPWTSAMKASLQ